jgi:hypothetical protein
MIDRETKDYVEKCVNSNCSGLALCVLMIATFVFVACHYNTKIEIKEVNQRIDCLTKEVRKDGP